MMFTGIIEKTVSLSSFEISHGEGILQIPTPWNDLVLGESVSVNGVCLTVAETDGKKTVFYLSPETLHRSHLQNLLIDRPLNLERAMKLGGRLSGHWVQGHVDGVGKLSGVEKQKESHRITVNLPPFCLKYCIPKGSICLDGVSLTINEVLDSRSAIQIQIIPYTWNHTRFSKLEIGDELNVEIDLIAKYIEKLCPNSQMP